MSEIIDFFVGVPDKFGRTIFEIQNWSDIQLETAHNAIQFLFPLHEPSKHFPDAPVLTVDDVSLIKLTSAQPGNMVRSLGRMRDFFGIAPEDFEKQSKWAKDRNHNLLRITRIIRSLRLFGLEKEAKHFFDEVSKIAQERAINVNTRRFWEKAMFDDIWDSLQ